MTPDDFRRIRLPAWRRLGISEAAAGYLLELERLDPPAALTTLAELASEPRWDGKKAVLAGSGRELVWFGGRWILAQ